MSSLFGISAGQKLDEEYQFRTTAYSSLTGFDINFLGLPVYRADTKEEFLFDAALLVGSIITGGWQSGIKYTLSKLEY
jgi:hypothetical protein